VRPDVLFIECCNFEDYPVGGQLSFAKQMVRTFGSRLALVGVSTDDTPVGHWVKRTFDGHVCDFFSTGRRTNSAQKPLIPLRIRSYFGVARYREQILSLGARAAFTSSREALLASYRWGWSTLCFLCSGLESPLHMPRYKWARHLANAYDSRLVPALQSANLLLAAADESAIQEFAAQTGGTIRREDIISFPTRADTDIFRPMDQAETRAALRVPANVPVFANVGRLNRRKGWDLLIDAFRILLRWRSDAHFYFVGDGEDRGEIEMKLREYGLVEQVHITGYLDPSGVAACLNAANVFVLGSHFEGWPTVMVEALATGKPIVSTAVSAAAELVQNGKNGYIVASREAGLFAEAMGKALSLDALSYSLEKSRRYALNRLAEDLGRLWAPLRS
jgi:glycosyltransferase involved in cell wall biosynthesis